jgi:hypothetical protein
LLRGACPRAGFRPDPWARNDAYIGCHCEERSDEAISGVGGFACRPTVQQRGYAITTFSQTLTFVVGLLYLEKRVSYRRLRKEFGLDDDTLKDVRHELIVKRLAVDEGWPSPARPISRPATPCRRGGNPGLGGDPPDVLEMESAAILYSPHCATLLRKIGLTVCTLGEKPV